jgi:hypothetical protein
LRERGDVDTGLEGGLKSSLAMTSSRVVTVCDDCHVRKVFFHQNYLQLARRPGIMRSLYYLRLGFRLRGLRVRPLVEFLLGIIDDVGIVFGRG